MSRQPAPATCRHCGSPSTPVPGRPGRTLIGGYTCGSTDMLMFRKQSEACKASVKAAKAARKIRS